MKRKGRVRHNAVWVIVSCFYLGQTAVVAQQSDVPRPKPAERPMMEALPGTPENRAPANAVAPASVTPPTILATLAHPIDLTTAPRSGECAEPRIQYRPDCAVHSRPPRCGSLPRPISCHRSTPGMNYDSHTGNLQQSDGNILSGEPIGRVRRRGINAVAAGTVNIPGVYYNINVGAGIFNYLASRQTVRQREFESIAVRNQVFLQVTWAYSELLRAEGRRAAQVQARDEAKRDCAAHG